MKFLLAAVNAKYIHSNLGIYSLKKYAEEKLFANGSEFGRGVLGVEIEIAEYTINHRTDFILQDIFRRNPDVVGFSCYIWNILYVKEIVRDLKKVRPFVKIWLGGPEVSYNAKEILRQLPEVAGVMVGEGEESFCRLVRAIEEGAAFSSIPGIVYRGEGEAVISNPPKGLMDLSEIPFPYGELKGLEHRILYYESSRGCPFSCSYCLSSIDKTVRFRNPELVKKELSFFLEQKVPQVKFVDRTFNCKKSHAMDIWRFIKAHDNGVTNFHFEISADLLDGEELELMSDMRPGLIQLEIGVQTVNERTIEEIRRSMDLDKVKMTVKQVNSFGNIHQHLDLIAGLPYEDLVSFKNSFNQVYVMEPEQLQLGFLKVLKGSYMEEMADHYGLIYKSLPPYEVLATKWLSYDNLLLLKSVEEMVELYYNSGQFRNTIKRLLSEFATPFHLFEALADYYEKSGLDILSPSRLGRYEKLYDFIKERKGETEEKTKEYRDLLMYDLYLRENLKSRPSFAADQSFCKEKIRQFYKKEAETPFYLKGYENYDSRQLAKMTHIEGMADGSLILFDYKYRDALYNNARAVQIKE